MPSPDQVQGISNWPRRPGAAAEPANPTLTQAPEPAPAPPGLPAVQMPADDTLLPVRRQTPARMTLGVFAENKLAVAGVAIVLLLAGFSFIGPLLYHTNQVNPSLLETLQPPGPGHPLGTDSLGFDVLGRLMVAGQSSLEVGVAAAALATAIGVIWGAIAGYFGGFIDTIMMRIVDVLLSIPILLLLIVLAVLYSPNKYVMILLIGGVAWIVPSRLVRGETLALRTREYIQAVRLMGGGSLRIVFRHIIPNAAGTIIVNATFQVADAILFLAALGFLGLGIQYPGTDWGSMLSSGSQTLLSASATWWLIVPPSACIVLVVVAFNFIGDALRDAIEVRLQKR